MSFQLDEEIGGLLAVDLDETLVEVNTFPLLVRRLPRALLVARRFDGLSQWVVSVVRRKVMRGSHGDFKAEICRLSEIADPSTLDRWARNVLAESGDPRIVSIVGDWDGTRLLTSAAPEFIVSRFADLVGFHLAHGSRHHAGSFVDNVHDAKVIRIDEEGLPRPSVALSDEPDLDRPLLRAADRAFLVDRERRLIPYHSADE